MSSCKHSTASIRQTRAIISLGALIARDIKEILLAEG